MDNYRRKALIVKVYDGDTITALVDLGYHITIKENIRLSGINAPEIRGKERLEGLKSKEWLKNMILNKEVYIETKKDKKGKYGRYIGTIYFEGVNINNLLVEKGFAVFKDY